jgi:hypothetical protein
MIEMVDLDREDLRCAGLRLADDEWDWRRLVHDIEGSRLELWPAAPPEAPKRRERNPTLQSQVRQLLKATRAAGFPVIITVEGRRLTATPARANAAPSEQPNAPDFPAGPPEPPRRSLFQTRTNPKQKLVL